MGMGIILLESMKNYIINLPKSEQTGNDVQAVV
jgi:hypothetical protein